MSMPWSLVSRSMRAAMFTASPMAVYSRRRGEPMSPTTTGSRVNADAHAERRVSTLRPFSVEPGKLGLHADGATHSSFGVVRLGHGRTEVGHDSVALELVESAPVREDRLHHACMARVEHGDDLIAGQRLAQGGE